MRMLVFVAALVLALPVAAGGRTRGYVKKTGTYVEPSYHSTPNTTTVDNYTTQGNVNPYTGKKGTKDPYKKSPRRR